jgi:hypothetical protein
MGRVLSRWHRRQKEKEEWSEGKRTNGEVRKIEKKIITDCAGRRKASM